MYFRGIPMHCECNFLAFLYAVFEEITITINIVLKHVISWLKHLENVDFFQHLNVYIPGILIHCD